MSQSDPENQAVSESQPAARQDVPASERGQSIEVVSATTTTSWRAPLPPPAALQQYDDVLPGSAKVIFQRWETQSSHRMRMESTVIGGDSKRGYLGIVCAFVLSLLMIGIGAYAIIWGNPWVGVAVFGTQTFGLASAFIYGTNSRRRERERKAADSAPRRD